MVEAALAAGIPVLVEKPLALTPDEGRQMVAAAESAGVKLGVNYPYRYDTGCYALARAVQAGALGEVRYARCHLPWHRDASHFGASGWHARLSTAGGGTLITQGSYPLDVARSATPLAGHSRTSRSRTWRRASLRWPAARSSRCAAPWPSTRSRR